MSRTIVVGGYGHVGRRLAARLAGSRPVVVAGRRTTPAAEVAAALDVEAAAVPVDARTGAGLDEVARPGDLVINAAGDDPKARLLRRSIALGCHYTDLTADRATIEAMLALDATARASEVSAVVGIGLAPGATNLLARAVVDDLGGADRVDIGILLSLADGFGPAALDWTLATLGSRTVDAFRDRTTLAFGPLGTYPAYSFGFPEQYFLPSTLAVTEARGWFGLRPAIAGRTMTALARSSTLRAALERPTARTAIARLAGKLPGPRRGAPVGATAVARRGDQTASRTLTARSESATTALCAVALIDCWHQTPVGVHLPETVTPPQPFLDALAAAGVEITASSVQDAVQA